MTLSDVQLIPETFCVFLAALAVGLVLGRVIAFGFIRRRDYRDAGYSRRCQIDGCREHRPHKHVAVFDGVQTVDAVYVEPFPYRTVGEQMKDPYRW